MTGIMPDSGVPCTDARNSLCAPALNPDCNGLWYSTSRCTPRFDPAAANAVEAELINVINRGGMYYDCNSLSQVETAIRYIVQADLPNFSFLNGGPNAYVGSVDPPVRTYTQGLIMCVIPEVSNVGAVTLDMGQGPCQVMRTDWQQLKSGDWPRFIPQLVCYESGYWMMLGLVNSQVPLILLGEMDFWIRTDGNDNNDGTSNDPAHAFLTIQGAWNAVGSRYTASPGATIGLRLGIPGTYAGANLGPYGANVWLIGDPNNRGAYMIDSGQGTAVASQCLAINGVGGFGLKGVNLLQSNPNQKPNGTYMLWCSKSNVNLDRCQFTLQVNNTQAVMITAAFGTIVGSSNTDDWFQTTDVQFIGNGATCGTGWSADWGSLIGGKGGGAPPSVYNFSNMHFQNVGWDCENSSQIALGNAIATQSGTTGIKYYVGGNSSINANSPQGGIVPGDAAGSMGEFSTFTA